MDITVKDLQAATQTALSEPLDPEAAAKEFIKWFTKRAERILKSAAQFGWSCATLDLPIEIAGEINKPIHKSLLHRIKELLPGCKPCLVEEEYDGKTIYRIEIAW